MNHSENINELATALSKCQSELTFAVKDSTNPFHKSKYADLSSVWDSIRQPLTKNGLCVVQTVEMQEDSVILVSILMHSSGQWIKSYLPILNASKTSQGQGSGITYARRYALAALVGCVQDDDDGESTMPKDRIDKDKKDFRKKEEEPCLIDAEKRKSLHVLSEQCDAAYMSTLYKYLNSLGIKGFENITERLYPKIFRGMTQNAEININK
jgi:hypothetical protein